MRFRDFLREPCVIFLIAWFALGQFAYFAVPGIFELAGYAGEFDYPGAIGYIFYLGAPLIALFCLFRSIKFYGLMGFEGKVWLFLFIGIAFFAIGEFIFAYNDVVTESDVFPTMGDAFYLIAYIPLIIGIIYKTKYTKLEMNWKKNAAIAAILILIIIPTIIFVAMPILQDSGAQTTGGDPYSEDDVPYYSFTVAEDESSIASYVVDEDGMEGVAPNATIVMKDIPDDADMATVEENFILADEEGNEIDGTVTVNGTILTFTPSENLEQGASYEAYVYVQYNTLAKAICLAYPFMDMVLLAFGMLVALYWGMAVGKGWYFISLAIWFMTVADILFAAMEWKSMYWSPIDLLFILWYLTLAFGSFYQKKLHEEFI